MALLRDNGSWFAVVKPILQAIRFEHPISNSKSVELIAFDLVDVEDFVCLQVRHGHDPSLLDFNPGSPLQCTSDGRIFSVECFCRFPQLGVLTANACSCVIVSLSFPAMVGSWGSWRVSRQESDCLNSSLLDP